MKREKHRRPKQRVQDIEMWALVSLGIAWNADTKSTHKNALFLYLLPNAHYFVSTSM